jgi:hypothetical protein
MSPLFPVHWLRWAAPVAAPAGPRAELYTNIDLAAHRLEISEKDDGYRAAIVRALRAH